MGCATSLLFTLKIDMQGIDRANEMLSAQLNSVSGLLCHTGMGFCVSLNMCVRACVRERVCVSGMSRRHMSHPHYTLLHRSQDPVEEDGGGSHVTCLIKPLLHRGAPDLPIA